MLLIAALTLVLSSSAAASENTVLEPVQADGACPVKVVTLTPAEGLSGIIELVPQMVEVRAFSLDLDLGTDAVEASMSVETDRGSSAGVVTTVLRALGKALLKAVATLIRHVV
jgi:hypothetical protein